MTKKILALALAGTTAFSVFAGAMSVNAAAVTSLNDDAYKAANFKIETATGLDTSSYDGTIGLVTTAWSSIDLYEMRDDAAKSYWAYDFVVKPVDAGSMDDVEDALAEEDYTALKAALAARYTATGTTLNFEATSTPTYYDSSSARKSVIDEFNRVYKAADDLDTDLYDVADLAGYGLYKTKMSGDKEVLDDTQTAGWLIHDILNANVANTATSQLLFYVQEYDRLLGSDGLVSTASSYEDEYYTMLDEMDLVESDYTEANWKRIEAYLLDAEKDADKGTEAGYKDAIEDLDKISTVKTIAPDYAALKSALEALFEDEKIPSVQPGTDAKNIPVYSGSGANYTYKISDYTVNRKVADEWYDFAGRVVGNPDHNDYVEGAYRKAMEVYANCRVSTKRAYVGQSVVDNAVAGLEDAIAAMDPNYDAANWKIAYLQEMIDKAQSLDESDYKTNTSAYKDFIKKLEAAEAALNVTTVNPTNAQSKAAALEAAIAKLSTVQKSVPATTKTEARDLRKEANDLYKNVEGKTDAQIKALKDAIEDCDNVLGSANATISEYASVIDALKAAITNYSQPQGWYQDAAGKYMYGEGDGYYVDGWKKIGNFWFFFNADGTAKQNEWFQDGSNWYYCGNSCVAYSGWGKVDGSWYYFSKANVMCTGWIRPSNSYYYLNPTSGKMVTGWAQIGGKWYYFSTDSNNLGAMLTSTTTPDGYQVGADGAMI